MSVGALQIKASNMATASTPQPPRGARRRGRIFIALGLVAALLATAAFAAPLRERLARWLGAATSSARSAPHSHDSADHGHGHDHPGHDEDNALELSASAEGTLGLEHCTVRLGEYRRTVDLPAIVVERPGRSSLRVAAPVAGVVSKIHPLQGEAVAPGAPLFDLRLTHEDVVQSQRELLKGLGQLEIVQREIERLSPLVESGSVSGQRLLEQQYEQQKLQAAVEAERQALLLHGLSSQQLDAIVAKRKLLGSIVVKAPTPQDAQPGAARLLQVQQLHVAQGQQVGAGGELATLADLSELYLEGTAFEHDLPALDRAMERGAPASAVADAPGRQRAAVADLKLLYASDRIHPESRTWQIYARLPNQPLRQTTTAEGHQFVTWRFRPGQRLVMRIVVDTWRDRIVLPAEAVVQDGAEHYVFQRFGDHFDRRPVRLEHRDTWQVVLSPGGGLKPGDVIAACGVQQLQTALKARSGGAIDPHAGHQH